MARIVAAFSPDRSSSPCSLRDEDLFVAVLENGQLGPLRLLQDLDGIDDGFVELLLMKHLRFDDRHRVLLPEEVLVDRELPDDELYVYV